MLNEKMVALGTQRSVIREWLKCIAGAVMVKKGVWLENLTGKGEDEKYLLRENEEKH